MSRARRHYLALIAMISPLAAQATSSSGFIRTWCESLEWITETGNPHKSKASRALGKLQRDKLVKKERDRWVLTKTGRKEAQDVIGKGSI